jgi:hypothetical protein
MSHISFYLMFLDTFLLKKTTLFLNIFGYKLYILPGIDLQLCFCLPQSQNNHSIVILIEKYFF